MTGFRLFGINRDGCHMWGKKCSLVPEHLISLYIHYILLNLSVLGLCSRINDSGLFAWISLMALSRTYFINVAFHNHYWAILGMCDSSNIKASCYGG